MKRFKNKLAILAVLAAGSLWGMMGIFVRRYNSLGLQTMDIVTIRAVGTAMFLLLFSLVKNRALPRIKIKDLWCFLGTGIGSIAFFNFCYFKTITLTSLSVAAILLYTAPAMVLILSRILFKEKLSVQRIAALVLSTAACVLVSGVIGESITLTPVGLLIGLGSGLGYALYSIFSRYAIQRDYDSFTITFYTFVIAGIASLPLADLGKVATAAVGSGLFMAFFTVAFALVSTILPYLLYTYGLSHMENGKATILSSVEPVVASLIGIIFYAEAISWDVASGVVVMLLAIGLCNLNKK